MLVIRNQSTVRNTIAEQKNQSTRHYSTKYPKLTKNSNRKKRTLTRKTHEAKYTRTKRWILPTEPIKEQSAKSKLRVTQGMAPTGTKWALHQNRTDPVFNDCKIPKRRNPEQPINYDEKINNRPLQKP